MEELTQTDHLNKKLLNIFRGHLEDDSVKIPKHNTSLPESDEWSDNEEYLQSYVEELHSDPNPENVLKFQEDVEEEKEKNEKNEKKNNNSDDD